MFIYYVYAYIRSSNNTPYYIGKGKGRRAFESHKKHGVTTPKNKSYIIFLEKNLSDIGACALERRYIKWYGRKDLQTGMLLNRSDGGNGGLTTTKEQQQIIWSNPKLLQKHSDILKTKWTPERKLQQSLRMKHKWQIQDNQTTQNMVKKANTTKQNRGLIA